MPGRLGLGASGILLLLVFLLILVILGILAARNPVIARIGFRNFLRGRRRTVLLVLGLLVATTIISSSLVVGDTVGTLIAQGSYISDGAVHEAVSATNTSGGVTAVSPYAGLPYRFYLDLNQSLAHQNDVAGVSPLIISTVSGFDERSGLYQVGMNLIGTQANSSAVLGSFTSTSGASLAGPAPGTIFLNPNAASDLGAQVGDTVTLAGASGVPTTFTVGALVKADYRGGFQDGGQGDVFLSLSDAQNLTDSLGHVNFLAVTNVGGVVGGVAYTSTVMAELNTTLPQVIAAFPHPSWLPSSIAAYPFLKADVAAAQNSASSLSSLFFILGLFSILAGCILIVGIFTMLAEERRGEMGVSRAVGMRRGQLTLAYFYEGLAYSVGAAALGTLLGVAVGFVLVDLLLNSLAPGAVGSLLFESFTVTPSSLVTAFTVGFLLTLGTILVTVLYTSRLNIVRAVRGIPEPNLKRRQYYGVAALGGLLLLISLVLIRAGLSAGASADTGLLGYSLALAGVALIATAFVPNRFAFTALGLAWVIFWAVPPIYRAALGPGHTADITILFEEGIFLIVGALFVYVFNVDLVARGITRLFRSRPQRVPVGKLAFAYPTQRRMRSSMTLMIFALVLFVVVAIASIGAGLQANLNGIARAQSGGYSLYGLSQSPIPDLPGTVQNNSTLNADFSVTAPLYSGSGTLVYPNAPANFTYSLAAAPLNVSLSQSFYQNSQFNFTSTLHGMSASQVFAELQSDPATAVVDGSFGRASSFSFTSGNPQLHPGDSLEVLSNGRSVNVTVIGVLAEVFIHVVLLNPLTLAKTLGHDHFSTFAFITRPGVSSQNAINDLKRAFFPYGLELIDLQAAIQTGFQSVFAIFDLLEVFAALGLMVGIVAIGITALRAVIERRSQIGMLRAVGFRQGQVLTTLLVEYSVLALVGILIGTGMGLLLAYNAATGAGSGFLQFSIPWENLAIVIGAAYALTLVATGVPAWRASRLPPAEAIRYTE